MAKKSESPQSIEYVRWIHSESCAVMGYGVLKPGSVHRVADMPGDPLQQLGIVFEAVAAADAPEVKHE